MSKHCDDCKMKLEGALIQSLMYLNVFSMYLICHLKFHDDEKLPFLSVTGSDSNFINDLFYRLFVTHECKLQAETDISSSSFLKLLKSDIDYKLSCIFRKMAR